MPPQPRTPDLEAQRAAMKKLDFLVGKWTGQAFILRRAAEAAELFLTEEAAYKLGGLILVIEGMGRAKSDGAPMLQAFAVISYEDEYGTYRMRAFNDGRFLETEVKLSEGERGMTWGFALGEITTKSILHINESEEWTEVHEITIGSEPPRRLLEVTVGRDIA